MKKTSPLFLAALLLLAGCAHRLAQPAQFAVFFHSNTADLSPSGRTVIGIITKAIHDHDPSRIEVAGHADGSDPHDAALADQRAQTVAQTLVAAGADPARIETQPSAPDPSATGVMAHKVIVTLDP